MMIISLTFNPARALISNYTFASSSGTYTPLVGGTNFVSGSAWDDGVSSVIQIPFAFMYNNVVYTSLTINANGFITMGGSSTSAIYCGLQGSPVNSIAGYGTDLRGSSATSSIQYGVVGSSPGRQFVIQWNDCRQYFSATGNHWSFQIILNETSNLVQVIMGTVTCVTTLGANNCADVAGESGDVGLLGNSTGDFNIRSVTNGTNTWAASVAGGAINAVCNMSATNFPASGLTFTWTPGPVLPMSFVSSTTSFVNNLQTVPKGATNNAIIQVQVVVTGTSSPFDITNLNLSTAGCTNALADISSAKVFFTGASNIFSPATQFGSTVVNPNGAYSVSGAATLTEGTNYFWISYNININATIADILSGCCTQITGTGGIGVQTPTVTCPAGSQSIINEGLWTQVTATAPHANHGVMLLLSDGTVMCHSSSGGADGNGTLWDKLTPDINGSYINGTWSTTAPMNDTRLFFSSQVLKDGRVYVAGGEYGTGLQKAETYDPIANTWTAAPSPGVNISDANSEILEDGRVLQALVISGASLKSTDIYNPVTNTFIAGPTCNGIHNESVWVKLPDNSILFVDRLSTTSERYIPATNTWITDATVPVALYDPFGDETGAAILLPDGRVFFIGAQGTTAFYTPSGSTSHGTWAIGPNVPNSNGAPDAPMAMMANGKVLCAVSPSPTSSATLFIPPTYFYEFDYLTNTFSQIHAPGGGFSLGTVACYQTNFLDLPDGTVLYAQNQNSNSSHYYVYAPIGSPVVSGKPTITGITQTSCTAFQIAGTQFNGISEGAAYGDDWQMATNYPIVRLTNGSNVYYCRSFNWNSTGVQRGNLADNVQFTLPAGLPVATYSLVVTANGIASDPVSFTPVPYLTSTLTAPATCGNTLFSYTPTVAPATGSFTWTRAGVAGISNAAVVIPQASNPNEVLVNTTANPISVVYDFTITSNGCSNTQQVTVVVNPLPAPVITGNAPVCLGSPITLDAGAGYSGYSWSTSANIQTISVSTAGTFSVTVTDGNGCTGTTSVTTTIPAYSITASTGLNGSITPVGVTNVNCGNDATYTITPDPGYVISNVIVDAVSQGAVSSYTFNNVIINHIISASFSVGCAVSGSGTTTPVTCFDNTNGTATITLTGAGSGAPGTYTVDGGGSLSYNSNPFTITGLAAGNHSIVATVTAGGCVSSLIGISVGGPAALTGSGTTTPTTCGSPNNGTATISLSAGTSGTFTVDAGSTVPYNSNPFTITGLAAGNHTIIATSAAGCVSSNIVVNVGASSGLTATYIKTNLSSCNAGPNGSIAVLPAGGTPPYTYVWSGVTGSGNPATTPYPNPGNVSTVTGLNYGFYNVTITDAGGCGSVVFTNIHIELGYAVFITSNGSVSSSCGNTGSITLYGNAGLQPYTYSLDGLSYQPGNTFTGLAAGPYTAYVKDAGGCISTKAITIGTAAPITVSPFTRAASSCANDGSIEIYRTGGIPPYNYSLDNNTYQPGNVFINLAAGPYTAYVKDSKGCTGLQAVTILQGIALSVSVSKVNTSACVNDGSIQVNASGGLAPYTYSIDGGSYQASNTFTGLGPGNYTISVKDFKNCLGSAIANISLNPVVVTAYATNATSCITNNGMVQLFRTGGYGPYTYSLDGNTYQTSPVFTNIAPGTYTGFVKDSKTCVGAINGIVVGPTGCPSTFAASTGTRNIMPGRITEKTLLTVLVYPNPSQQEFTLVLRGYNNKEKISVTVSDLLGRTFYHAEGTSQQEYKFGNNFSSGMYYVEVVQGFEKRNIKIVKE